MKFACMVLLVLVAAAPILKGNEDNLVMPIEKIRESAKVLTVTDGIIRDDNDQKILTLKFSSLTDNRDHSNYEMRVTIEVQDKDGSLYCGQTIRKKINVKYHYADNDWVFQSPLGRLGKPKLSAYVVEFGVDQGGVFIPLDSKCKNAGSADEILARARNELTVTCTFQD